MLQIAVINESTAMADGEVQAMIPAFDAQWNKALNAVWGVRAATFAFNSKQQAPPSGSWWVVFLDNSDQANALAHHDLTNEGLPSPRCSSIRSRPTKRVSASARVMRSARWPSIHG